MKFEQNKRTTDYRSSDGSRSIDRSIEDIPTARHGLTDHMLFRSCATFARAACARSRRGFLRGLECGLSLIRFEDGPHSMCTYLLSIACIYNVILQLRPSHSLLIERVLESTLRSLRPSPSSLPPHPLFCSAF